MEQKDIDKIMGVVDHTLLKAYATEKDVKKLIEEANSFKTYSVCIEPIFAKYARRYITRKGYNLRIAVTVDFPFGVFSTKRC